ncbi:MAG: hypothetical protein PVH19_07110 [Planctomycetia bacterium]|jgi:hypothetical protein
MKIFVGVKSCLRLVISRKTPLPGPSIEVCIANEPFCGRESGKPGWNSRVCDRTAIIKYIGINKCPKILVLIHFPVVARIRRFCLPVWQASNMACCDLAT